MKKYYCDRCGEEIKGEPLRMVPSFTKDLSMYMKTKLSSLMEPLANKDFCEECLAEIVDFALNKNTCDECVQQMMDENAMLRGMDEETGPDTRGETDTDGWSKALDRMEQNRIGICYMVHAKEIAKDMKTIREECRCQSETYRIPLQPIDPELISKYRKAVKKYGVPKQCTNIPVSSSGSGSEYI